MKQRDWAENLSDVPVARRYNAKQVAARLGISLRQLQRLFRKHLGATPQSWLRERRLEAARRMLITASSVKEVAFFLGFSSQEQLARDFRRHFGVKPSTLLEKPAQSLRRFSQSARRVECRPTSATTSDLKRAANRTPRRLKR